MWELLGNYLETGNNLSDYEDLLAKEELDGYALVKRHVKPSRTTLIEVVQVTCSHLWFYCESLYWRRRERNPDCRSDLKCAALIIMC